MYTHVNMQTRVYTVYSASILNTPFNVTNTLLLSFFRAFQVFILNRVTAVCHYINSIQSVCQRKLSVPLLTSGGGQHLQNSNTSTIDEARPKIYMLTSTKPTWKYFKDLDKWRLLCCVLTVDVQI